jgi:hypothetical protein
MADTDRTVREHVLYLLRGGGAHVDFDRATAGLPASARGQRADGLPWSPWELVEHMRLAQADILEFSRSADYRQRRWPEDYWPGAPAPPDARAWQRSLDAFRADLDAMQRLVADPQRPLLDPLDWGDGQTLLREGLLVADHNAYHLGQLGSVRRALGAWGEAGAGRRS